MTRKPTMSPTRMSTYLACATKYRWTFVDSRGRMYFRARSTFSFGMTLHKVLQRFHDAGDDGVTTVAQAVAAVEESWVDAGYESAEEMAEAIGEGQAIVERYVGERIESPPPGRTLFVEKRLTAEFERFRLVGQLDRVQEHDDGRLEVVDYKSGSRAFTVEDVAGDLAMSCYQLLLSEQFPGRPVSATLVSLRGGGSASYAMSAAELAEFRRDVQTLGGEILDREFDEIVPVAKPLCARCEFVPLCRRHEEFDFAAIEARPPEAG